MPLAIQLPGAALYYNGDDDDDDCHFIGFFLQNSKSSPFEINKCLASFKKCMQLKKNSLRFSYRHLFALPSVYPKQIWFLND